MTDVAKDANRLVGVYRRVRDAREAASSAWRKQDEEFKVQLDLLEQELLKLMKEQNTDGLRTENGTVSKTIKEKFWSTDWASFGKWVLHHGADALDLYEHRIAQRNMAEFISKNPTDIPPGLQIDRRYAVVVRKPSSSE